MHRHPGDAARHRTVAGPASSVAAIGVQPLSTRIRTLNRIDFVHYFEGGAAATQPRAFVAGSDIIGEMTSAAAESIVAAMSAWLQGAGSATAVIESLSGAVGDVGPADSAFPWRRQAACVQWYTEAPFDTASTWLAGAHAAVARARWADTSTTSKPDTAAGTVSRGRICCDSTLFGSSTIRVG